MTSPGVAVVTGASAGIGREFCAQLAARGYDLIAAARDAARLEGLKHALEERHGTAVEAFPADLTQDDAVTRLAARIRAEPRLAMLVNNAGFGILGTLVETDPARQEAMVRLHVLTPMRLSQAAVPVLLRNGRGAIVNVSSVASFLFSAGNVNYCATKAYLTNFSEGLAAELAGSGVQVQALCPGFTRSEFHQRAEVDPGDIPAAMWLSAEEVVRTSLGALDRGGPVICIPGFRYKVIVQLLRVLPHRAVARLSDRRRRGRRQV